ncbi:NUDIX hydrolase [Candidatus Saccharibacteria bacterium]|nr:NUDIX hydrolase [Candidatus Saccharibacteria bacterium]
MSEITEVKHKIQKNILSILMHQKKARFRDMRPPRVDTNLYSYHLTQLIKSRYVYKMDKEYTLDIAGLIYSDRVDDGLSMQNHRPKIVTMFVIQNSDGDILLQRRTKQPYIDMWTLPGGKMHMDDVTIGSAAIREAAEKLRVQDQDVVHAGDCYIRVKNGDNAMTTTLVHVFTFNRDDIETNENIVWARPHKLHTMELAPGISEIIARTFFRDPFYFEEFEVEWSNESQ